MQADLEERLESSGRFADAVEIDVCEVRVDAFGEGEYEARLRYPPDSETPRARDYLAELRHDLEGVLPRAWVVAFRVSSRRDEANRVVVTFDYVPEGALTPS